ncbi:hypothetical protein D9C73_002067 [Collichthys lucidus]|uniref:Uncharacterized protein n=1 Tax=Collichthys lucidus TaxID=240159 RepID=A0A4U5U1Q3_COLLU|nr:hypothetical protein D9C73_002067 [Collichthys lucidus]
MKSSLRNNITWLLQGHRNNCSTFPVTVLISVFYRLPEDVYIIRPIALTHTLQCSELMDCIKYARCVEKLCDVLQNGGENTAGLGGYRTETQIVHVKPLTSTFIVHAALKNINIIKEGVARAYLSFTRSSCMHTR